MEIREASEADIPDIVALLKLSLGESLMPKSERYWRWKHLENPFGPSPVLLCWEGKSLVGVRAFMRWEWIQENRILRSVRAVDTATHPAYQGKGIFKKLTMALVEYCKEQGVQFVFNTPNQQSKPGYLKMEWEEAGRLPVKIGIQRPFKVLMNLFTNVDEGIPEAPDRGVRHYLEHAQLGALLESQDRSQIRTNISLPYLRWRYLDVPVAQYVALGDDAGTELANLLIGRIKITRLGRELRITNWFSEGRMRTQHWIKKIKAYKKEWKIDYTTMSDTASGYDKRILSVLPFSTSFGPVVTIRPLALAELQSLRKFHHWSPTLGDLELF